MIHTWNEREIKNLNAMTRHEHGSGKVHMICPRQSWNAHGMDFTILPLPRRFVIFTRDNIKALHIPCLHV